MCTYQFVDPVPFAQTLPGPTPQLILKVCRLCATYVPSYSPTLPPNKVLSPFAAVNIIQLHGLDSGEITSDSINLDSTIYSMH